jgi:hypothetical protein
MVSIPRDQYRSPRWPVMPGKAVPIEKVAETPGVFMYHCASGVEDAIYGMRDEDGFIPGTIL